MDDQSGWVNLDNLLLQLALETRELAQNKDDLTREIQNFKADIEEKKKCVDETNKSVKKLEQDILQKQNTVKCYKENVKSLRGASDLLLQYEKMLEAELERRQESYNQDMQVFQERMENYWKIFQQHKEGYLQNPLATKLLKIQDENEEIERRIRAKEEEIIAKEKELKALHENHDMCDSVQKHVKSNEQRPSPSESDSQSGVDVTSRQDPQPQVTKTEQENLQIEMDEKALENNQDQADGVDESSLSEVGVIGSTVWADSEISREQSHEVDQNEQELTAEVDMNMKTPCESNVVEEMTEAEEQQESEEASVEKGGNEGEACPVVSPMQMSALDMPTFSLISSSTSQGQQLGGEPPVFDFSAISGPNTPTFSGFDCSFEVGPSQHEESPFTFSSSYFSKYIYPPPPNHHAFYLILCLFLLRLACRSLLKKSCQDSCLMNQRAVQRRSLPFRSALRALRTSSPGQEGLEMHSHSPSTLGNFNSCSWHFMSDSDKRLEVLIVSLIVLKFYSCLV